MEKNIIKLYNANAKLLHKWAVDHLPGLFIFNLLMLLLILLHSIGYFHPFLVISANLIIFISMVASIFLLGVRSKALFVLCLIFFFVGMIFKAAQIDIWAERAGIYTFQTLLLGSIMLIIESYFAR